MTTFLPSIWTRLRTNFRNPVIRRNVAFYMGGKLLGLTLVLIVMWTVVPQVAHALERCTEGLIYDTLCA